MKIRHIGWYIACLMLTMNGCSSYGALVNFDEGPGVPEQPQKINNLKPIRIEEDDILTIAITSLDQDALSPFVVSSGEDGQSSAGSYLVSSLGTITFPTIGEIAVKGLTIEQVQDRVLTELAPYFSSTPIVQARLANFQVSVNGEVNSPGSISIPTTRFSVLDAVTRAGDFTAYAMRDSVLIIRETEGQRIFEYVNFRSADIFNSDFFYLKQNDVIYVKPEKTKVNSVRDPGTRILPWITTAVTVIALAVTLSRN